MRDEFKSLISGDKLPRWFFASLFLVNGSFLLWLAKNPHKIPNLYFFGLKGAIILWFSIISLIVYFGLAIMNWKRWFVDNKTKKV